MVRQIRIESTVLGTKDLIFNDDIEVGSIHIIPGHYDNLGGFRQNNPEVAGINFNYPVWFDYSNPVRTYFAGIGLNTFVLPNGYNPNQDVWKVHNHYFYPFINGQHLCIRIINNQSYLPLFRIMTEPGRNFCYGMYQIYKNENNYYLCEYRTYAHVVDEATDYIDFTPILPTSPSSQAIPYSYSISSDVGRIISGFYYGQFEPDVPPEPEPIIPAEDGTALNSNSLTLNYHLLDFSKLQALRNRLWQRNFLDLFSEYNNKAALIPYCMVFPVKIDPIKIRTDSIIIGNNEKIYVDNFYISYNQKENGEDKTLLANFSLSNYEKTNSYIDYPTVTEYKLFLPFIGFINIDYQYLNKGIEVSYYVDYTTGYCVCNINSNGVRINEIDIQLAQSVVLAGGDNTAWKNAVWNLVGTAASVAIMAGTGSLLGGSATYSAIKTTSSIETTPQISTREYRNPKTNRLATYQRNTIDAQKTTTVKETSPRTVEFNRGIHPRTVMYGVSAFTDYIGMEAGIKLTSSTNPNSFINSYLHPFLLIRRPIYDIDMAKYAHLEGRPLNDFRQLINLTGYTEVGNIHLNIDILEEEISEISEILQGGIVINAH